MRYIWQTISLAYLNVMHISGQFTKQGDIERTSFITHVIISSAGVY